MKNELLSQFIDHRNAQLWELLNNKYKIEIRESSENTYSCFTQNNQAIIYVLTNNISAAYFTHELLHIYLKYKEFYLGASIKCNVLYSSSILKSLLSKELLEHIGNCLDHLKMFKIYQELGFEDNKFLYDFDIHKCSKIDLQLLKDNFKILNKIYSKAIDFYIGKLVAILCDPNIDHDYTETLNEFEKLDTELYHIVNQLIEETKELDIEKDVYYHDISYNFDSRLTQWVTDRQII